MSEVIFIPYAVQNYVPPSNSKLDVYWDPVDGDDANNGLFEDETPGTQNGPVQTAGRVWQIAGPFPLKRPVLIHAAGGATYDFSTAPIPDLSGSEKMMCLYADFDWDPRNNLVEVIATGAAGVGTNGDTCILPAPVVADVYTSLSMRYIDGPAVGQIRSVSQHPTTALTPTLAFNPAPVAGNTFEVFRSTALVASSGRIAHANNGYASTGLTTDFSNAGLCLVNFDAPVQVGVFQHHFGSGYYLFYGFRTRGAHSVVFQGLPQVQTGAVAAINVGVLAQQFGLPQHLWGGWGIACDNASASFSFFGVPGRFVGYITTLGSVSADGNWSIRGGCARILNNFSPWSRLTCIGPSTALPFAFGGTDVPNSVINFAVQDGGQQGTIDLGANCVLRHRADSTSAMLLIGQGTLLINTAVTGSNPGTGTTMNISRGFRVFSRGVLNLGRAAADPNPNDIIVEALAAFNKTALSSSTGANSIRADATTPGAFIRRMT